MSKRSTRLLLEDILDAIEKIVQYTCEMDYEAFVGDTKTFDAVVRNFEIIGEAANMLPDEIEERYPDVEWHRIIGLRDRLIHGYFGVDPSIVWQILRRDLEPFRISIYKILNEN